MERADANMASGDAGEHGAGQRSLPVNSLAGGYRRQGTGRRDAECVHGLADQIFTQDRTKGRATVAPARERRRTGTFELDIVAIAIRTNDFAQQDRPPVTKSRRKMTKLMTRICLRNRLRAGGHAITPKHLGVQHA